MQDKKIKEIKKLVDTAEIALQQARNILANMTNDPSYAASVLERTDLKASDQGEEKIIEGVFDGQQMIGPDGKKYSVPANYASKSKLVEGDLMKLTILQDGTFLYKQIGPQVRDRVKATLIYDNETGEYRALTDQGESYKLLTASVTYFKVNPGDKVIILLPKGKKTVWAALENIFGEGEGDSDVIDEPTPADTISEIERPDLIDFEVGSRDVDSGKNEILEDGTDDELEDDFDLKEIETSDTEISNGDDFDEADDIDLESVDVAPEEAPESNPQDTEKVAPTGSYLDREENDMPIDFDVLSRDAESKGKDE